MRNPSVAQVHPCSWPHCNLGVALVPHTANQPIAWHPQLFLLAVVVWRALIGLPPALNFHCGRSAAAGPGHATLRAILPPPARAAMPSTSLCGARLHQVANDFLPFYLPIAVTQVVWLFIYVSCLAGGEGMPAPCLLCAACAGIHPPSQTPASAHARAVDRHRGVLPAADLQARHAEQPSAVGRHLCLPRALHCTSSRHLRHDAADAQGCEQAGRWLLPRACARMPGRGLRLPAAPSLRPAAAHPPRPPGPHVPPHPPRPPGPHVPCPRTHPTPPHRPGTPLEPSKRRWVDRLLCAFALSLPINAGLLAWGGWVVLAGDGSCWSSGDKSMPNSIFFGGFGTLLVQA